MNHNSPHILHPRGTTLIEVLAGLVILGTLLVSVTIARGRFLRQWKQADQRLTAIKAADQLVERWVSASPDSVPINAAGVTEDADHLPWKTLSIPSPEAATVDGIIVRLNVYGHAEDQSPMATVDFLIHNPRLAVNNASPAKRI